MVKPSRKLFAVPLSFIFTAFMYTLHLKFLLVSLNYKNDTNPL